MTPRPDYGTQDGHGRFGILDRDDDGRLVCHECGHTWAHLATHVRGAHGLSADEYREAHGLSTGTALVGTALKAKMAAAWMKNEDLHRAVLEGSRDPDRARASNQAGSRWRPELVARRIEAGRARRVDLTDEQVAYLGDLTDIPGWAERVRLLVERDGVNLSAVARATGLSVATVGQRLRRYPRQ